MNYPSSLTDANIYYVDGTDGNDANDASTWVLAKKSIQDVMDHNDLGPGDIIYVRKTNAAHNDLAPGATNVGALILALESVNVSSSTITFTSVLALDTTYLSDGQYYVYIYNSFRGNSGAFQASSVNGKIVTVDTSEHPGGTFVTEVTTDSPWNLQAAIIRPIRIIGCDVSGTVRADYPELVGGIYGLLDFYDTAYWFISYLYGRDGSNAGCKIVGTATTSANYIALDHVKIRNTTGWVVLEIDPAEYGGVNLGPDLVGTIIQHCELWWLDPVNDAASGETIYHGHGTSTSDNCVRTQFMYNYIWLSGTQFREGDGIDGKSNNRYTMIWGNHFYNIDLTGATRPGFGVVKMPANETCIANNYFDSCVCNPGSYGVVTVFSFTITDVYIFGNIFYNNAGSSITGSSSSGTFYIYNNTFYGRKSGDIAINPDDWNGPDTIFQNVYNNIIQNYATGILVAAGSAITNDADNIFYGNTTNYSGWTPSDISHVNQNPGLTNPAGGNFSISSGSYAKDKGTDLSATFDVDNHNAATPSTLPGTQPIVRSGTWDIGAYEYGGNMIFNLAGSTYIAASGEDTTARLTAPAGKTTSDFQAGRIQDDENPSDAVTLDDGKYDENEYCIYATDDAVVGTTYRFRLTKTVT